MVARGPKLLDAKNVSSLGVSDITGSGRCRTTGLKGADHGKCVILGVLYTAENRFVWQLGCTL